MTALGVILALAFVQQPAKSQAAPKADDKVSSGWQELFKGMAEDYEIVVGEERREKLELQPKPVLRWSQPVRGGDDGAVYVWLDRGRPAAAGSIFAWRNSDGFHIVTHEFHSLADGPLAATWRGRKTWLTDKPGVERKPVPDAPAPADSPAQRLRQMRDLAGQFSANSIDREDGRWELRLMAQPIYRYGGESADVLDGAMFAFAQGTDPEVLLLIEARTTDDGRRWEYSLARFSDLKLQVRHRGTEVWNRTTTSNYNDWRGAYNAYSVERRKGPTGQGEELKTYHVIEE